MEQSDARNASRAFPSHIGSVRLVITSPPYLDTTHSAEDQWLRNWFMGGKMRPSQLRRGDDRHVSKKIYWSFLTEAWAGMRELLSPEEMVVVVRIGGSKILFDDARDGVLHSLSDGTRRRVTLKSASTSEIVGGQLRSFRPHATGTKKEHDIVAVVHQS